MWTFSRSDQTSSPSERPRRPNTESAGKGELQELKKVRNAISVQKTELTANGAAEVQVALTWVSYGWRVEQMVHLPSPRHPQELEDHCSGWHPQMMSTCLWKWWSWVRHDVVRGYELVVRSIIKAPSGFPKGATFSVHTLIICISLSPMAGVVTSLQIYLKNKLLRLASFCTRGASSIAFRRFRGRLSAAWAVPVFVSSSSLFRFSPNLACLRFTTSDWVLEISNGVGGVRLKLQEPLD